MEKRLSLSFILALVISPAYAEYTYYHEFTGADDGIGYKVRQVYTDNTMVKLISEGPCWLSDASNAEGEFTVPVVAVDVDKFGNEKTYGVNGIGYGAFENNTRIKSVTVPNTIVEIEAGAFINSVVSSVILPETLTTIKEYTFSGCSELSQVALPASLQEIGMSAFQCCTSLRAVSIPGSVRTIGQYAFKGCMRLYDLRFEDSEHELDVKGGAFDDCSIMKLYYGRNGNAVFDDCDVLQDLIIGDKVKELPMWAFQNCPMIPSVKIPSACKRIGDNSFEGCAALKTVEFEESSDSYVNIGFAAFRGCDNLSELILPKYSLGEIEESAFADCIKLTSIRFPNSLEVIGRSAFQGCIGLDGVDFGHGLEQIGAGAFEGCTGLTILDFPAQITFIGGDAFFRCDNLEEISFNCDYNNSDGIYIGDCAFSGCAKLRSVNGLVTSELYMLYNYIGSGAFKGCTSLEGISVNGRYFGREAFAGCTSLKDVSIGIGGNSDGEIHRTAFEDCPIETLALGLFNSVSKLAESPFQEISTVRNLKIRGRYGSIMLNPDEFKACRSTLCKLSIDVNLSICEPFVTDSLFLAGDISYVDSHGYPSDEAFGIAKVNKYIEITKGNSVPENAFAGSDVEVIDVSGSYGDFTISENAFKECDNIRLLKVNGEHNIRIDAGAFSGARIKNIVWRGSYYSPRFENLSFENSSFDEEVYENTHFYYVSEKDGEFEGHDCDLFKHRSRIPEYVSGSIPLYVGEPDNLYRIADSLISVNGLLFEYAVTEADFTEECAEIGEDGIIHPYASGQQIAVMLNGYSPELETSVRVHIFSGIYIPTENIAIRYEFGYAVPEILVARNGQYYNLWFVDINDGANLEDVVMTSSNDDVLSVSYNTNGYWQVDCHSSGHARIIASSVRHPEVRDSSDVYMLDADFEFLDESEFHLKVGQSAKLEIKVPDWLPREYVVLESTWNRVSIDNGVITAIGPGMDSVVITVNGLPFDSFIVYIEDTTGISASSVEELSVRESNGAIVLGNVPCDVVARIYDLSGSLLFEYKSRGDDIVFSPKSSGFYIVDVNGESYKVVIR